MTQLELQALADVPTGIYQDLEEQLMANIIQHVQDYGEPIATDTWSMQKLAEIGKLTEENIKIIAKTTGSSATAMERMLLEVAEEAIQKVDNSLKYYVKQGLTGSAVEVAKSKNVTSVVDTLLGQADSIINLCNTNMLYKANEKYTNLINNMTSTANEIATKQSFLDTLNKYTSLAVTGAESRQSALTKCIKAFNEKGIPAFVDSAGREWTPEAYVNMCMRSTSNTMAAEAQMARCDDYSIDLVEVDSHSGARPKCARDQGKIFDRANKSEIYPHWKNSSYGEPDGLLGVNCGHHIYPFIDGVSIRRYYPTEDLEANDKLYKETQTQRALERSVRNQKRECMLYDQLGDEDAFQAAAVKLKQKEANLKSYVNSNDELTYRSNRVQVVGYDKSVSASAVAANKKYQKEVAAEVAKYSKKNYNKDGTIIVTDDWTDKGKTTIPKTYKTNAIIQTKSIKGNVEQIDRTFYNDKGEMEYQVHSGSHGNDKAHPYGTNGEHKHSYTWENETIKGRAVEELSEQDRKENGDIL